MRITPRSFPYPVLSRFTDDILPNGFEVRLEVIPTSSDYLLNYCVSLDHADIRQLISNGDARLIIHVECQSNFYRKAFSQQLLDGSISIPVDELAGHVEVSFLVVAARSNASYRISGMHSDYGPLGFSISRSDILALLETKYFFAEKDPNVLKRISSIIQVAELGPKKKSWEVDLDDNMKIFVRMSQADMQSYHLLRGSSAVSKTLVSLIVVPALVEALHYIRTTADEELEIERQRRWFSVLEKKVSTLGVDLNDSGCSMFEIAQRIMEQPSVNVLSEIDDLIAKGD